MNQRFWSSVLYHYGKDKFKSMEEEKMRYVQQLLQRRKEESVDQYMLTLRELEQLVRNCYAETINLSQEKFLAMMLIDGCFIVELFRKYNMEKLKTKTTHLWRKIGFDTASSAIYCCSRTNSRFFC